MQDSRYWLNCFSLAKTHCQNIREEQNNNDLARSHFAAQWPGFSAFTPFLSNFRFIHILC